jgi:parallel beta-helix repeat protein
MRLTRSLLALTVSGIVIRGVVASAAENNVVSAAPFIDRSATDCGLQKAIDSLDGKTAIVDIPAGEYPLARYLFLRSGVTLRGAGTGKTVLTVRHPPHFSPITAKDDAARTLSLENTNGLTPGARLCLFVNGRATHPVHRLLTPITAVSGSTVTVTNDLRRAFNSPKPYAVWGYQAQLTAAAAKGDSTIQVDLPALAKPGYAIAMSGEGDQWNHHYNVIRSIAGNTLTLDRPLTITGKPGDPVAFVFAMITAEGQTHIGVENLTIRGYVTKSFAAPWAGFMLGGIHTYNCSNIVIRNVTVENWNGDGISIQTACNVLIRDCQATGNFGHGFHPGTGMKKSRFEKLTSLRNDGDGFYYCWSNHETDLYDSVLKGNNGSGVGGLGNPHDNHCTIAGNTIEDNGECGIHAYGGDPSGTYNVIRNNIIRNNSRNKPGTYPGIALYAIPTESCLKTTIESNRIESTSTPATQKVGIEERHAAPAPGRQAGADPDSGLFLSDRHTITGNRFSGHETADIIVAGQRTVVGGDQGKVERRSHPQPAEKAGAQ